ncbi:MAG: aspartate/glutamate racemase family protein [Candidatus Micrarchaeota archaeon]|nr:aspartate/glutamate racemase family protein [Candidatus Micrarchaeota archaeon]
MKIIGLIGGMSWESSAEYYKLLNEFTREKLGGWHSSRCLMYSLDFAEIEKLQHENEWAKLTLIMIDAAKKLEAGGAECILICTNTMHKMAEEVQKAVSIPLIHIADATGEEIKSMGLKKVGLLGTKFTLEEDFYKGRLSKKFGLEVIIPSERDRQIIHNIIYDELCLGKINQISKEKLKNIIAKLEREGAQGIVLGCTEIPLLIKQDDLKLPIFDTAKIHVKAGVEFALKQ